VLGLVDKDYGEVVCAVIVPHENVKEKAKQEKRPALTLEELSSWAKERLAPYKVR
jgi:malonyl-CoA/methylmalonyl-CoA synthetase